KCLVPKSLKHRVMGLMHNSDFAGHQSTHRTTQMAKEAHSWPGLSTDVKEFVNGCVTCQYFNIPNATKEVGEYPDSEQPFRVIAFDFAGPFGTKKNDFKHILVIVDTLSRFVWLQPTKSTAAPEVIKTIRDRVIPLVGAPSVAIVDQQSSYMSKQFQDFCRTAGILLKPIPQGASDGNGISERCIRSVTNHVKR
ncbi:unnamed protein product, partial [Heterosigma akashiwo]